MVVEYCCLCGVGRRESARLGLQISYFSVPHASSYPQQRLAWLKVIGRHLKPWQGVCSRHFESGFPSRSIASADFSPSVTFRARSLVGQAEKRRNESESCSAISAKRPSPAVAFEALEKSIEIDKEGIQAELERLRRENEKIKNEALKLREENLSLKECLIGARKQQKLLPENFLEKPEDFRQLTNLTPPIFEGLFKYLSKDLIELPMWHSKLAHSKDGKANCSRVSGRNDRLSPIQELFMTLVRLRVGLTLQFLSINLGLDKKYLCSVFIKVVNILAIKLEQMCPLVVDEQAQKLLFPQFFEHFPHVVLLGDCTEISMEKSANIAFNKNNYSFHKGKNTCKLLVLATYGGSVRFCSHAWGGKISDQALVRKEKIRDKLLAETKGRKIGVIFDRGFPNLELEFAAANIEVITPAFRGRGDNLSFEETVSSRLLAHYRIQIERVNAAIKTFRILQRPIPLTMLYSLEAITKCCAFLTNLMKPVIKPKADLSNMVSELIRADSSGD